MQKKKRERENTPPLPFAKLRKLKNPTENNIRGEVETKEEGGFFCVFSLFCFFVGRFFFVCGSALQHPLRPMKRDDCPLIHALPIQWHIGAEEGSPYWEGVDRRVDAVQTTQRLLQVLQVRTRPVVDGCTVAGGTENTPCRFLSLCFVAARFLLETKGDRQRKESTRATKPANDQTKARGKS